MTTSTEPLAFQDLILTLHRYWGEQGCAILQPYDIEVGAGTLHPATVLRALGPRPWKAAYVQPSRFEAFSRTIMEAWPMGVRMFKTPGPVMVKHTPGLPVALA